MHFKDVFTLSWNTVSSNKLRSGLTIAIIAFGIMALVGIITAIKAMDQKFSESFSSMGASAFTVRFKPREFRMGNNEEQRNKQKKTAPKKEKASSQGKVITKDEAEAFIKNYTYPSTAGISIFGGRSNIASQGSVKTNPNVMFLGGDEKYLLLNGIDINAGRNFNHMEVASEANVCLLGYDVAKRLFKGGVDKAVNSMVRLNDVPYRVLGVLASRGSVFGFNRDNMVLLGYSNLDRNFSQGFSYIVGVLVNNVNQLPMAMGEAESAFRSVRKLTVKEDNNFTIDKSDAMAERAMKSLGFLTISATVIGLITLIGSAIGLMNIMLVSVNERTKEVGLIKAIGGKGKTVRFQFLLEAIIISVLGALCGILLGVGMGNLFSIVLHTGFVVPWNWVFLGIALCTVTGLLAGIYPAVKAGKLNPIEALRYE